MHVGVDMPDDLLQLLSDELETRRHATCTGSPVRSA